MEISTQSEAVAVTPGAVPELRLLTSGVDDPVDAWRACLDVLFDDVHFSTGDDFQASLTVRHLGTFLLCRSFAGGTRFSRSARLVERDDVDHLVISCLLSGRIAAGSPARAVRPGDITIIDLTTPLVFAMSAADALHVIVPRTALPSAVASTGSMPWRVLKKETAMGILLRGVIDGLFKASQYFDAGEAGALGAYFPELLGCLLATPSGAVIAVAAKGDLGRRLRRHIEDNLNRTDLTSARLAREVGISRSQLYRQFEASGGVDRYIRRRRLRRSLQALTDPRRAGLRIGDIAFDVGFSDEAHFSRLFRQAYGQSPREARTAARDKRSQAAAANFPGSGTSFAEWLLTLGVQ